MSDSVVEISAELKRKINQRCEDTVESLSVAGDAEKQLLSRMQNNENGNFHIFMYVCPLKRNIKEYEMNIRNFIHKISLLRTLFIPTNSGKMIKVVTKREHFRIPIRDLSQMKEADRVRFIKNTITSEERKQYTKEQYMMYAQAFQLSESQYFFTLSMCVILEEVIPGRKLFQKIIEEKPTEALSTDILQSWENRLQKIPGTKLLPKEKMRQGKKVSQTLLIPKSIQEKIIQFEQEKDIPFYDIILIAFGTILCKYMQEDQLKVGFVSSDTHSEQKSIILQGNGELQQLCMDIQKQLMDSPEHRDSDELPVQFQFTELPEVDELLAKEDQKAIRELQLQDSQGALLSIKCNLFNQAKNIMYSYQNELISQVSIEHLHTIFYSFLEKILDTAKISDLSVIDEKLQESCSDSEIKERLMKQKITYLEQCRLFSTLTVEEIYQFADKCKLRSLLELDYICQNGQYPESIYLIVEGRVEESNVGADEYIKTVQILKAGDFVGLEALQTDMSVKADYQVLSEHAKVLEIPVEDMNELVNQYPEMLWELLKQLQKDLHRFKKLWILS